MNILWEGECITNTPIISVCIQRAILKRDYVEKHPKEFKE